MHYPDISDILARKAEGRLDLAKLPYGEKIMRAERMRDELAGMAAAREARKAEREARMKEASDMKHPL